MNDMEWEHVDGELLAQLTSALEEREEILEAYLFGSHARGQAQPHSDIDVAVYVDEEHVAGRAWGYQAQLTTDLMVALGTNDVDGVVLNKAPILLYHRVLRDGVRLMSRDLTATNTRAGEALSRDFDFLPQLDKMDRARRHAAGAANADHP